MIKSIVDKLFEHKLQEAENLQIEYKGYTIYDTLPKSVRASGDLEIIDSSGAVVGYAGDVDQAKSIIDKLSNSDPVDSDRELEMLYQSHLSSSPYFIYKEYKNDNSLSPHYGKKSPMYYWSDIKKDFVPDFSGATFYKTRSEATKSKSRKMVSKAESKYYYSIGDLNENPRKWRTLFMK